MKASTIKNLKATLGTPTTETKGYLSWEAKLANEDIIVDIMKAFNTEFEAVKQRHLVVRYNNEAVTFTVIIKRRKPNMIGLHGYSVEMQELISIAEQMASELDEEHTVYPLSIMSDAKAKLEDVWTATIFDRWLQNKAEYDRYFFFESLLNL